MKFTPGQLVVFEGLDATGKSTQMKLLEKRARVPHTEDSGPEPLFTHQPTGSSDVGKSIYRLTEKHDDMHPVTRQLLHLASHAEHYDTQILPALADRAVFMDRCWWSTIAYGWFGGKLGRQIALDEFIKLAQLPTQGRMPDLVFMFNKPYADDEHNTNEVHAGYGSIVGGSLMDPYKVIMVPGGQKAWVHVWIIDRLVDRQIITMSEAEDAALNEVRGQQWKDADVHDQ